MSKSFVPLAETYKPGKIQLYGRYLSEKLDGFRSLWDGGVTRGLLKSQVPYANCGRDKRFKTPPIATGLWSRYANVIHAPEWFLDSLPNFPLDIELFAGRQQFERVSSTVRKLVPIDSEWKRITALVLDCPPVYEWLEPRRINERNIKLNITAECLQFWLGLANRKLIHTLPRGVTFEQRLAFLRKHLRLGTGYVKLHDQLELPLKGGEELVEKMLAEILAQEPPGEGVVIKWRSGQYICDRTHDTLKYKPWEDAEAVIEGYYWGDRPDNTRSTTGDAIGKLLGLMGGMYVNFNGVKFKLGNGFTEEERYMMFKSTGTCAADEGLLHPGEPVGDHVEARAFPRGSLVTFRYREKSNDGVPKEARFHRVPVLL